MKAANIERNLLFPTPLWCIEYEGFAEVNRAVLEEIRRVDWLAEHQRRGLERLYESRFREDVFITTEKVPSAKVVVEAFEESCSRIALELGWDLESHRIHVTELWAHVTPPGQWTQVHDHNPSHLSCAYYVSVAENCGNIQFFDDRKHRSIEPESSSPGPLTSRRVTVPAKAGMMVIFPAWMSHAVEQNLSGEERVSLSMNATLVPKAASSELLGGLGSTL